MNKPYLILLVTILPLSVSTPAAAQSGKMAESLDRMRSEMQILARQNNLAQVAQYYAEDATVNGFDVQLKGIEEIRDYWQNLNGRGMNWEWDNVANHEKNGIMYQTGTSHLTLEYGERERTFSTDFLLILEKQADGEYRITSDFYRPSRNIPTQPFDTARDSVQITAGPDTLFCMVFKPATAVDVPSPAVLLLQGGGDAGLANYFYEAEFFAENGLAALICDKSGAGLSTGPGTWVTQTFEEKTTQYRYLLNWLRNQPYVEAGKTGIHGLSEGEDLPLRWLPFTPKLHSSMRFLLLWNRSRITSCMPFIII